MSEEFVVNGLPLPSLLIGLMQSGKWKHPGDEVMLKVIPFLLDRVVFLESVRGMQSESSGKLADIDRESRLFHMVRGSKQTTPVKLPWLDVDKAVVIAVCWEIGADVAIALDYRTNREDPRVVASDWLPKEHIWREVSPTFSEFIERLGIK